MTMNLSKLTHSPFAGGFVFSIAPSLKPWKSRDAADIERVCRALYRPWERIIARSEELLVCLIIGNGEHILKWTGNLDDPFEWDRYRGHNNARHAAYGFDPIPLEPYMENPPAFVYRDLLVIGAALRRVAAEAYGKRVRLMENFEPGPEFCESPFRYVEHPEILNHMGGGHGNSIAFDGVFHADTRRYAAYPDGIPEGEPFGRFLGRQMRSYGDTFGIEAVCFSNGLGFGTCPWTLNGRNFDGERFGLVAYADEARRMTDFWELYKAEAPYPVMATGTNWPVGADLATKCVPLREFYDRRYLSWPLGYTVSVFFNDSVGFAMQSLLSRSAHTDGFGVNFYLHDMWYPQNPFEDYPYDGEPFDLYMPASVAVIGTDGKPFPLNGSGVGANYERGDFRPDTAAKFLPHLERALDHLPDATSPLTLLYPFDEFHAAAADPVGRHLSSLYFADCFAACAMDGGLPLNSVCATGNFAAALQAGSLRDTILFTPMPFAGAGYVDRLLAYLENGGQVLLFGPEATADARVMDLLGLAVADGLEGELTLSANPALEAVADESLTGGRIMHRAIDSGGEVSAVPAGGACPGLTVLAEVEQAGARRVYAIERADARWKGGRVVWLRGSLPFRIADGERIAYHPAAYVAAPRLARYLLARFGYTLTETFSTKSTAAQLAMWRHRNGLFFTGYAPDNTCDVGLKTPLGAPLLVGMTCDLREGVAHYHIPTTLWNECRVFVRQREGKVRCRRIHMHKFAHRVYSVTGLNDAEVTICVPREHWATAEAAVMADEHSITEKMREAAGTWQVTRDDAACAIRLADVTGRLQVHW
jgi:hypothetical protein